MTDRGQSLKSNLQKPLLQVRKEVESLLGLLNRGGAGSGHFGHAGRPGKVGGSRSGDRVPTPKLTKSQKTWSEWALDGMEYMSDDESLEKFGYVFDKPLTLEDVMQDKNMRDDYLWRLEHQAEDLWAVDPESDMSIKGARNLAKKIREIQDDHGDTAGVELKFRPIDYSFDQTGLITAWSEGEQVGSLSFGAPTKSKYFGKYDVELGWVNVPEEHRRKGIATAMMDEFYRQFEGKRVVPYETTKEGKAFMEAYVNRHYGPGPHPGTGTPQDVHGKGKGSPLRTGVFNPNDIERVAPLRGFCFERSAQWLVLEQGKEYEQARLVHGTVMGQGPLEGVRFTHAWVEIDDWVYDVSQDILSPKDSYYELAQAEDVVFYTETEAAVNLLKEKNWGPWEEYLYDFKEQEIRDWIKGQ